MSQNQASSSWIREFRWFNTALLLLFITLKLTGHIDWSWWWVLAPVWIPFVPLALFLTLGGLVWLWNRRSEKARAATAERKRLRDVRNSLDDYRRSLGY